MKRLSDYKNEDAIILWGELIEPFGKMLASKEVQQALRAKGKSPLQIASDLLKSCPKEAIQIMKTIDDTEEITGVTAITRLLDIALELLNNSDFQSFFTLAGANISAESGGSVTENTEAEEI